MSVNFLLANAISSLVNARSTVTTLPYSDFIFSIFKKLESSGLLQNVSVETNLEGIKVIKTSKSFNNSGFLIKGIKLFSKPGRRVYFSVKQLSSLLRRDSLKFYLVSTSFGVMELKEAIAKSAGGEMVCEVILN